MPSDDVIQTLLEGLDKKFETRFNGVDKRLDTSNGNVAAITVWRGEVDSRHEIEDAQAQGHKATRSTIRFWVLIVGVPLAISQVALQAWGLLS